MSYLVHIDCVLSFSFNFYPFSTMTQISDIGKEIINTLDTIPELNSDPNIQNMNHIMLLLIKHMEPIIGKLLLLFFILLLFLNEQGLVGFFFVPQAKSTIVISFHIVYTLRQNERQLNSKMQF